MKHLNTFFAAKIAMGDSFGSFQQIELQRRQLFENVLLILLGVYLFIDTVNGLFVKTLGLPNFLSAGYKQGLFLLMLLFAFQFEPRRFFWCLLCVAITFIWAMARFYLVDNIWFTLAFQEAIKVIYLFVMVLVLSSFRHFTSNKLNLMLLFSLSVVVLNVVFALVGIGQSTYGNFGAKGFFYSGNAVSGVIVISSAWFLTKAFKRSIIQFLFLILFLSAVALLIGTKSGFLGVLLCALIVIALHLDARALAYGVLLLFLTALGLLIFGEQLLEQPLFQRVLFFYDNGGLTRVLFSGRDVKLIEIWPLFERADFWQLMLGLDMQAMQRAGVWRVEFDWADMQINFGILLSLLVYLGYIALFGRLLTQPKNSVVSSAIIAFVVLIMISAIAGHVLYNGMVTPLWAVLTAAALNNRLLKGAKGAQVNEPTH
ncbi:O-antigen ligase family protein [Planctobacterium marinum]|uniref:Uncharacterized protein n=1 Tax=Planctobacterium marinum TaxID=1631968 RepID=A0AA48HQ76_9ALTE|nr:hypothetical protein MACH26_31780 [Planctobacterium marinum]